MAVAVDVLVLNATGPQPEAPTAPIDSEVAERPPPGRSAYAAAKSAQIGFVPVEPHDDVPEADRLAYLASVPAGRMGTREDIAHAVTGQRLVVDGGRGLA